MSSKSKRIKIRDYDEDGDETDVNALKKVREGGGRGGGGGGGGAMRPIQQQ